MELILHEKDEILIRTPTGNIFIKINSKTEVTIYQHIGKEKVKVNLINYEQ